MGIALATNDEHRHTFKVRYKLVDGQRIMVDPVCKCAGCEVTATITVDGYRVMVTFVGNGAPISYTAMLISEVKP